MRIEAWFAELRQALSPALPVEVSREISVDAEKVLSALSHPRKINQWWAEVKCLPSDARVTCELTDTVTLSFTVQVNEAGVTWADLQVDGRRQGDVTFAVAANEGPNRSTLSARYVPALRMSCAKAKRTVQIVVHDGSKPVTGL
jgi:uncharacterized protein YndB with AHSA1/START domain